MDKKIVIVVFGMLLIICYPNIVDYFFPSPTMMQGCTVSMGWRQIVFPLVGMLMGLVEMYLILRWYVWDDACDVS